MTLHGLPLALSCWRPARRSDLPGIAQLADSIHPSHPERPAVFADRLALHPTGMLLAEQHGQPIGYAIAHPWRGPAPLLDHCLDRLPAEPDRYWLHDLALLPAVRGRGIGRAALLLLTADARQHGLRRLELVAVGAARRFWERAGFIATPEPLPPCYGDGATCMQRLD